MKNEFVLAFNEVIEEKQLPKDVVLDALKTAMVSAYRRAVNASNAQRIEADIDIETGKVVITAEKEIVESVQDDRTEVTLEDALRSTPNQSWVVWCLWNQPRKILVGLQHKPPDR
jgi:N utilization substance protein A